MNNKYIAILINAEKNIIDEVEYSDFEDIQNLIGCDTFCLGTDLSNGDTLYVDDEGLLKQTKHGFYFNNRLFVGNGLVCGTDAEGDNQDVQSRIGEIERMVEFLPFGDQVSY